MNVSAMNAYAEKYAWNPNIYTIPGQAVFTTFDEDCTNFASQILTAGGIKSNDYWYNGTMFLKKSVPWNNANAFANYFNIGLKVHANWFKFQGSISPGHFIGYSLKKDGSIHHIGYVTNQKTYKQCYGGACFDQKAIRIAQHTGNYVRWEDETGCGWRSKMYDEVEYVRIGI